MPDFPIPAQIDGITVPEEAKPLVATLLALEAYVRDRTTRSIADNAALCTQLERELALLHFGFTYERRAKAPSGARATLINDADLPDVPYQYWTPDGYPIVYGTTEPPALLRSLSVAMEFAAPAGWRYVVGQELDIDPIIYFAVMRRHDGPMVGTNEQGVPPGSPGALKPATAAPAFVLAAFRARLFDALHGQYVAEKEALEAAMRSFNDLSDERHMEATKTPAFERMHPEASTMPAPIPVHAIGDSPKPPESERA